MDSKNFKLFKFNCEFCSWWKIVKSLQDYPGAELKRASVSMGEAKIEDGKTINPKSPVKQARKFKCISCGRAISYKEIDDKPAIDAENNRLKKLKQEVDGVK